MPSIPPQDLKPKASIIRWFYCTICGSMWFKIPPDGICLICKKQNKFSQIDFEAFGASETLPT
jgi:hypothetical protein